ncbi:hypothetical protein J5N97_006068 [Dioscorea zingiberensis]|uniref:DEUBAD domain-containing protein n=1 Tax=Dioscorea zingiberensis TaxID=325984 RepID=A0A9D5DCD1_9LILI|nr:hypothetical protein J5N97_006068 [Dioscorea zingiberensis]
MAIVRSNRVAVSGLDSLGLISGDAELSGSENSGLEGSDASEHGEAGTELCEVGNQCFSIPLELYGLEDLGSVLSVETWNDCLSEEERFKLAEFLPDMDQETFGQTLAELFEGKGFHFGSPIQGFFYRLRSGFFEPSVMGFRRGLIACQRRQHYYFLKEYQDSMVRRLLEMKDVWAQYEAYAIEDRVSLLNALRSQRDSHGDLDLKKGFFKQRHKKRPMKRVMGDCLRNADHGFCMNVKQHKSLMGNRRLSLDQIDDGGSASEDVDCEVPMHGGRSAPRGSVMVRSGLVRSEREQEFSRWYDASRQYGIDYEDHEGYHGSGKKHNDVTISSYGDELLYNKKMTNYNEKNWVYFGKHFDLQTEMCQEVASVEHPVKFADLNIRGQKRKGEEIRTVKSRVGYHSVQMADLCSRPGQRAKTSHERFPNKPPRKGEMGYDSSDLAREDEHANLLVDQYAYSSVNMEDGHFADIGRMVCDHKNSEILTNKDKKLHEGSSKNRKGEKHYHSNQSVSKLRHKGLNRRNHNLPETYKVPDGSGYRNHMPALSISHNVRSTMPLVVCNSTGKERKGNLDFFHPKELEKSIYSESTFENEVEVGFLKKDGKRKVDSQIGSLATMELVSSEKEATETQAESESENLPFTLITPTVHNCFSFSIIHLLSAVRRALIAPHVKDTMEFGIPLLKDDSPIHPQRNVSGNTSEDLERKGIPLLNVLEIVSRVKSNPGDPCILETQEPLQDLVRGALKLFSSKTAPLGAKDWKALVSYEKSNKSWSWVGPLPSGSSDEDNAEERTSSEAWGIPHKLLVKLVDSFANWLKSVQAILQQIGCLQSLPTTMFPTLDEKERFRELKSQKNPNTISPSSSEVRAFFRREEVLRYSVSDRAFFYTAADGKKSSVAPLKKGGSKPTSRAREHYMLKLDRPAHVTILCLVRDAAARLPGSIGTRADICTLIRDSQYVVEDVSDSQVNQVVSGALDRLHYERDPCVQFDNDRKLWVYLHREREEEDFEDDGTSSTKKSRRPKKDPPGNSHLGAENDVDSYLCRRES